MKWIIRERQLSETTFNAGSKARNDVDTILRSEGFTPLDVNASENKPKNAIDRAVSHIIKFKNWVESFRSIQKQDVVVIQYPIRNHTIFFGYLLRRLQQRDVASIGIIHDLESLRSALRGNNSISTKIRYRLEEITALKFFSLIIVHNDYMRKEINSLFGIPFEKMVVLEIFDYLSNFIEETSSTSYEAPILIAGNLARIKSGYIYSLPGDVSFDLYGTGVEKDFHFNSNIAYCGRFDPDVLPSKLHGKFGLVWDGSSSKTCEGVYGEYLKINNPHKASLYLASGIPIIVWTKSALASFVDENKCGLCIDSLYDLNKLLVNISFDQYSVICREARKVGQKIREGYYTKKSVSQAIKIIEHIN